MSDELERALGLTLDGGIAADVALKHLHEWNDAVYAEWNALDVGEKDRRTKWTRDEWRRKTAGCIAPGQPLRLGDERVIDQ